MAERRKAILNARIDADIKKAAELAAQDDRRTLTGYLETLMEKDLRERGYLPSSGKPAAKRK